MTTYNKINDTTIEVVSEQKHEVSRIELEQEKLMHEGRIVEIEAMLNLLK